MKRKGRPLKIILIVLVALIALIISAIHIALYTPVKDKIIDKATASALEGDVDVRKIRVRLLRSFPNFELRVEGVSLTYPNPADTVVGVRSLKAGINLPALIGGCIDVRGARIDGLLVDFDMPDTLMIKPSEPKEEEKEEKELTLPCFKIDFALSDTRLYLLDLVKDGHLEFALNASNTKDGVLDAAISGFCLQALGIDLDAELAGYDLLGRDPRIEVDADALAKLKYLQGFMPEDISADGEVSLTADGVLSKTAADMVASVSSPYLRAKTPIGRVVARDVKLVAGARQGVQTLPSRRPRPHGDQLPDFLREEDFRAADIDVQIDSSLSELIRTWNPRGEIHLGKTDIVTPMMPLRNTIDGFDASFNTNEVRIDQMKVRSGVSDLSVKGAVKGFGRMLTGRGRGFYRLDLEATSNYINVNQILAALESGSAYSSEADTLAVSDEQFMDAVVDDSISGDAEAEEVKLFVIPANVMADVHLNARRVRYSDITARGVNADLAMKHRCVLVKNLAADTPMGSVTGDAFYSTKTKEDISAGFDINLKDITAEKIIELVPAVDTLVPMLSTFKGNLNVAMAATTKLDTTFAIQTPTLNGAFRISGCDLSLDQEGDFKKIARLLMFRDRKKGKIDSLYIGGVVTDNKVRVFPFLLSLDRYSLSLGGVQAFDGEFDYRVSLLKSPILVKFGVRLRGDDFSKIGWKLIKPQFNSNAVPSFKAEVESMMLTQKKAIRNVHEAGSDEAISRGRRAVRALDKRREDMERIDHVEELSEEEMAKIDSLGRDFDAEQARLDSIAALPPQLDSLGAQVDSLRIQ